jgi:septal ring factor EnvC (AmiA/AmiB activator)
MSKAVLLLVVAILCVACADDRYRVLDRQLEAFRLEQEKERGQDLEKLYEEEKARSEELSRKILELEKEIREKERELAELEERRDALDAPDATRKRKDSR